MLSKHCQLSPQQDLNHIIYVTEYLWRKKNDIHSVYLVEATRLGYNIAFYFLIAHFWKEKSILENHPQPIKTEGFQ